MCHCIALNVVSFVQTRVIQSGADFVSRHVVSALCELTIHIHGFITTIMYACQSWEARGTQLYLQRLIQPNSYMHINQSVTTSNMNQLVATPDKAGGVGQVLRAPWWPATSSPSVLPPCSSVFLVTAEGMTAVSTKCCSHDMESGACKPMRLLCSIQVRRLLQVDVSPYHGIFCCCSTVWHASLSALVGC